jgi:hypothetical protein
MRPSGWNEADEYPFWTVGSLTCVIVKRLPTYQSICELWAKHVLSYMDSSLSQFAWSLQCESSKYNNN